MSHTFTFIGVTTTQSSMMRIFPIWRDLLGLAPDLELVGLDLPLHASPERYRDAVVAIRDDSMSAGALVTTHKVDLFAACRDLFAELDRYAEICCEVSCIGRRPYGLVGVATDPIASGRSLEAFLPPDHFARTGGEVLCLGAGGAGTAIAVYLLTRRDRRDRPSTVTVVDRSPERLSRLLAVADRLDIAHSLRLILTEDSAENDSLVRDLLPGSLIVNATGMGKDVSGSPLTDAAVFPEHAATWDLNYRGDLTFLRQAASQREDRSLVIEDGWRYFIYGWAAVLEVAFERAISEDEIRVLAKTASFARPAPSWCE